MGNVINLQEILTRRANPLPGNLLMFRADAETKGKYRVKIVRQFSRNMFGKYGFTDFKEIASEYISVYFPGLGYVDMRKSCVVMDD